MTAKKVKNQVETVESATEEVNTTQEEQPQSDRNVLLGSISYSNVEDYERFLEKMDINQSIFVLIAGCNYAQSKGILTIEESELISKSIRTIKRNSN